MSNMIFAGEKPNQGGKAAILIHGRGASAESILSLQSYLNLDEYALVAPQASNHTWYPFSFMAPDESNQPKLEESLSKIQDAFGYLTQAGVSPSDILILGFSQGACLSLEFAAKNAQKFAGVVAFTGGLIGEKLNPSKYSGDFQGTTILISGSKQDMHVPLSRMQESADLLTRMGADVTLASFHDSMHTIRQEEVDWVNKNLLG
ncbi:alpha/beta hydrolase [Algoriphagus limi]|uniref:Dienelactone hydrolase family protein n=1 Tax=Algoriphagus limi TaxID=2975273 RepID=A0ABT2GA13_9BACT|nr:dienelactone hydrolase family protein [Algoriphagus limi]MCS5491603.1 dienelactone hydrolase family protein [Algoriphagus limi]